MFLTRVSGGFQFQSVAVGTPPLVAHGLSYAQSGARLRAFVRPRMRTTARLGMLARRFGDRRVLTKASLPGALGGVLTAIAIGFCAAPVLRALSGVGGVML